VGLRQVGEPDLDERTHRLLEPGVARDRERLLPALARLLRIDTLLEAVVAGDEQLLDSLAHVLALHKTSVTRQISTWSLEGRTRGADPRAHSRRSPLVRRGARGDPGRRRADRSRR